MTHALVFMTPCSTCDEILYWNQKPGTAKDVSKARCSICSPSFTKDDAEKLAAHIDRER